MDAILGPAQTLIVQILQAVGTGSAGVTQPTTPA